MNHRVEGPAAKGVTGVLLLVIGLVIVVLLAAIAVLLWLNLSDNGSADARESDAPSGSAEPSAPETFTASGTLDLIGDVTATHDLTCWGDGGYSDLGYGTQVVVRDSTGATVGVGSLNNGKTKRRDYWPALGSSVTCKWSWSVPDIPAGSTAYSVEVAHRGEIAFTEADSSAVKLTLGY